MLCKITANGLQALILCGMTAMITFQLTSMFRGKNYPLNAMPYKG
jgi:hypothetical protein